MTVGVKKSFEPLAGAAGNSVYAFRGVKLHFALDGYFYTADRAEIARSVLLRGRVVVSSL